MFPLQSTSQSQHTCDLFYTEVGLKFPRSHKRRVANASFSQADADADQFTYFLSEYFSPVYNWTFPIFPMFDTREDVVRYPNAWLSHIDWAAVW